MFFWNSPIRQVDDGAAGLDGAAHFRSVVRATEVQPHRRSYMSKARADVAEIEELENKRYDAMLNTDIHVLDDLLHEELIYSHSTGGLDTKEMYLNALRDKVSVYKTVKRNDQTVKVRDDIGLVFNHVLIHAEHKGSDLRLNNRLLAVWSRDKGIWRLLAVQSGAIPKQIV